MQIVNGIKMFSSTEVAELLGVTERTIGKLRKDGLLRSVKLGKGAFTSEESLNDYLNGKTLPKPRASREKVNK